MICCNAIVVVWLVSVFDGVERLNDGLRGLHRRRR